MYKRGNDKLVKILRKQRKLMEKYEKIEEENGMLQTNMVPVALDSRQGQARLKDFCWRITEECAEAMQAYNEKGLVEFHEELSDVLHFLAEFTILSGWGAEDIVDDELKDEDNDTLDIMFEREDDYFFMFNNPEPLMLAFIVELGLTANCLKNKPWKQSLRDTDMDKYYDQLNRTWAAFIDLVINVGFTPDILYEAYFDKNSINQKRQESGY